MQSCRIVNAQHVRQSYYYLQASVTSTKISALTLNFLIFSQAYEKCFQNLHYMCRESGSSWWSKQRIPARQVHAWSSCFPCSVWFFQCAASKGFRLDWVLPFFSVVRFSFLCCSICCLQCFLSNLFIISVHLNYISALPYFNFKGKLDKNVCLK